MARTYLLGAIDRVVFVEQSVLVGHEEHRVSVKIESALRLIGTNNVDVGWPAMKLIC